MNEYSSISKIKFHLSDKMVCAHILPLAPITPPPRVINYTEENK